MLRSWRNPSQLMLFQVQSAPSKEGGDFRIRGGARLQPDNSVVEYA